MARKYDKTGFGLRLAEYRRDRGFRDAGALADAVEQLDPDTKVTRSTIINLEAGRKPDPTVSEVVILARALGVHPAALLLDLKDPFGKPDDIDVGDVDNLAAFYWLGGPHDEDNNLDTPPAKVPTGLLAGQAVQAIHDRVNELPQSFTPLVLDMDTPAQLLRVRRQMETMLNAEHDNLRVAVAYLEESGAHVPDHLKTLPDLAEVWARTQKRVANQTDSTPLWEPTSEGASRES